MSGAIEPLWHLLPILGRILQANVRKLGIHVIFVCDFEISGISAEGGTIIGHVMAAASDIYMHQETLEECTQIAI